MSSTGKKISQKEYLKKYLSGGGDEKKKKKKKPKSDVNSRTKIIDDDVDLTKLQPLDESALDLYELTEDAPQVVGIVDERPAELQALDQYKKSQRWKVLDDPDGDGLHVSAVHNSRDFGKMHDNLVLSGKMIHDDGVAKIIPSQRKQKDDSDGNSSPPRSRKEDISQLPKKKVSDNNDISLKGQKDNMHSPPRRSKRTEDESLSDGDNITESASKRSKKNDDDSPPRRKKKHDDAESPPRSKRRDEFPTQRKRRHDGESSPQINRRDDDKLPLRRNRRHDDKSPPRRTKRDDDESPLRRNKRDDDESPPRRNKRDDNESPPRRNKIDDDESPPRRNKRDVDESPPRRNRRDDDESKPRRNWRDVDESPPRRNRRDDDESKPRRNWRGDDESPPRRNRTGSNESPSRKKKRVSDESPPRRKVQDEDASPPRRQRLDRDVLQPQGQEGNIFTSPPRWNKPLHFESPAKKIKVEKCNDPSAKMEKTLDGKVAGLQDAKRLKRELMYLKRKEEEVFTQMDDKISGKGATVVQRDRKTGLKRDLDYERNQKLIEKEKNDKNKEKYDRWGKGVKQTEEQQTRLAQDLQEMTKPLARYADDEDLESHLRNQEREGDPMLEYLRGKKKDDASSRGQLKLLYQGPFPPNRYNIRPGHRWDGVDRSCGYEKQWFENINARKALQEDAYKWSTEDM